MFQAYYRTHAGLAMLGWRLRQRQLRRLTWSCGSHDTTDFNVSSGCASRNLRPGDAGVAAAAAAAAAPDHGAAEGGGGAAPCHCIGSSPATRGEEPFLQGTRPASKSCMELLTAAEELLRAPALYPHLQRKVCYKMRFNGSSRAELASSHLAWNGLLQIMCLPQSAWLATHASIC